MPRKLALKAKVAAKLVMRCDHSQLLLLSNNVLDEENSPHIMDASAEVADLCLSLSGVLKVASKCLRAH